MLSQPKQKSERTRIRFSSAILPSYLFFRFVLLRRLAHRTDSAARRAIPMAGRAVQAKTFALFFSSNRPSNDTAHHRHRRN